VTAVGHVEDAAVGGVQSVARDTGRLLSSTGGVCSGKASQKVRPKAGTREILAKPVLANELFWRHEPVGCGISARSTPPGPPRQPAGVDAHRRWAVPPPRPRRRRLSAGALEPAASELLASASGGVPAACACWPACGPKPYGAAKARAPWIESATQGTQRITPGHVQAPSKPCPACRACSSPQPSRRRTPPMNPPSPPPDAIQAAHQLYCQLTGSA